MAEKTIYFIRHGLILSNTEEVYSGRSDESLTDRGAKHAEDLGREIRGWGISTIYSSPLRRTMQTAEIINQHVGGKIVEDADLLEMDLGPWTGLSKVEVAERFPLPYRTWVERPAAFRWNGMETLDDIRGRAARFLGHFRHDGTEKIAAAVTHAAIVKCGFIHCNELDLNTYHSILVPNLSIHRVSYTDDGCKMVRIR